MTRFLRVVVAAALVCAVLAPTRTEAAPVGLDLTLLVDVSGSVDANEFNLQRSGYVNAFNSAAVVNAILNSVGDGIAARLIYWSSAGSQQTAVGWTQINDATSASAFATAVNNAARPFGGGSTAPGSAVNYAVPGASSPWFQAGLTRRVFDISGDGAENDGANTLAAVNAARALGITLNGLVILGEAGLQAWYQTNIVTPGGGFLEVANDFGDFGTAVEGKILREIVPEPSTLALLAFGLIAAGRRARRRS